MSAVTAKGRHGGPMEAALILRFLLIKEKEQKPKTDWTA